jgi:rod shape determining protein RodA
MLRRLRLFRGLDWTLFAAVLALCLFGLLMIYSATRAPGTVGAGAPSEFSRKQLLWLLLALGAFGGTVAISYQSIARWHFLFYGAIIALLVAVLAIGRAPTGAASWIAIGSFRLQPSEFAKLSVILSLSAFVSRRTQAVGLLPTVLQSLLIAAAPVLLVLVQPDFGTALVIIAIWFGTLGLAGARARHLAGVLVCGVVLFAMMWGIGNLPIQRIHPRALRTIIAHIALKDYQKRRLTVFLNPRADPLGAGYHVIQSKVGIGSGEAFGRGLLRGTQSRLRFIPGRHTDFIFSVVGEETGFAGALLMLSLFLLVFWRGLRIAARARDPLGSLLAAGAVTMLFFHTIVNVGMAANIMPITGIPLPFVSYGGSNLVASFVAFGLIQNVHMRTERMIF